MAIFPEKVDSEKAGPEKSPEQALPAFAELHCLSNFTFLRGASHPEELVAQAASLGYSAIAMTDECTLSGVVKAHVAAKEHQIKLIVGAEFTLVEGQQLVFLAPDRKAYGQLSMLITRARRSAGKGDYRLSLEDLQWGGSNCLVLWVPDSTDIQQLLLQGRQLKQRLPNLWLALELFFDATDLDKAAVALTASMRLDLPLLASNDVHMHSRKRKPLQDLVTAIRLKTPVSELGRQLSANAERYLRPLEKLLTLYPRELLEESAAVAGRCHFSLDELRYEYPQEVVPEGSTPSLYLRQLTFAGARKRWPQGIPSEVTALLEKELLLVAELSYEYYFLTVYDIVQFARSQGILCQGRGSAANSAVCYCLNITEVDPSRMHLLFERFVSKERNEPPDIDVDFEHERREEVIQYIYKRYGRERAALAATLITYRPRSAVRDVGKALGLDLDLVDLLAKSMAWWEKSSELETRLEAQGIDSKSEVVVRFLALTREILGFPRHLSQHVGGFVISQEPISQLVPVENAAMADRTVIQWDKNDLEALGLLKIDVLGLGMLTAIRKALEHLNGYRGSNLNISQVPPEDPETYRLLQRGDSVGVFQVESRAQMSMLPRLKPTSFYDLVIEVAIVRPGPIQGDMVHPYLRRRQGLESVEYSNADIRRVLERTLGVPIFQEQVIELAMVAAGFSAGEADQLRRAMAAWKRRGGLEHFEQKLIDGMLERGHPRAFAERVFQQIKGFGEYGFPESHAASFALLVYISAWLKCHEPAAFYCGLLNSQPMGFYSPSQLVQDAAQHGVELAPVDVQHSDWEHRLESPQRVKSPQRPKSPQRIKSPQQGTSEDPILRLGLRLIKGLSASVAERISANRPYANLADLAARADLSRSALTCLARAGALESVSGNRHQSHWEAAAVQSSSRLLKVAEQQQDYRGGVALPGPGVGENLVADYHYLGLTLGPHPMQLLRNDLPFKRCKPAARLENLTQDQFVRVAGLVTCRQRPSTASGVIFMTLEDETGNTNVVIWTSVLERFRAEVLQAQLLLVKGVLEREGQVIHVVAGEIEDHTSRLNQLAGYGADGEAEGQISLKARNFH